MRQALLVCFVFSALTLGCKKSDDSNNGGGDAATVFDAPPLSGDVYSLKWPTQTTHMGDEQTQCIWMRLNNASPIKVHQMHNVLGPGSHHVIVYKDDMDTTAVPTPFDCQPFTGALNPTGQVAPMMITQKMDDALTLPTGVAYTLKPNQMIRLEMHFINTGDSTITDLHATSDFYAADPTTIHDEANILFIGTADITIPANSMFTVNEFFTPSRASLNLDAAKFFAITGHTHHLGTDMEVNLAATNGGTKTPIYAPMPFQWSEPITAVFQPNEFMVPPGGGFDFTCKYYNSTSATVKFGESANNEMCFFWAYYYPSQGAHVCFHSAQYGNIDICCPDAGSICNQVGMQF